MSEFQLILTIIAIGIFIVFFKQLFSGNYPKRGIDYEINFSNDKTTTIPRTDKTFKHIDNKKLNRIEELLQIAYNALENGDNVEAKKALESLLILEPNNIDAMRMLATAQLNMNDYVNAKETLLNILKINPDDDLSHNLLANALHKLGEDELAIKHHQKAIELDKNYAPYYYNYANTMYDLQQYQKALELYKKSLELDSNLKEAKKMKEEIENATNQS